MTLKVLLTIFLCLFIASMICNAATTISNASEGDSALALANAVVDRLTFNGTVSPMGDPKTGPGWPTQ